MNFVKRNMLKGQITELKNVLGDWAPTAFKNLALPYILRYKLLLRVR